MSISRRTFLALGASVLVGACTSNGDSATDTPDTTGTTEGPAPSPPSTAAPVTTDATTTSAATTTVPATTTTTIAALSADPFTLGVTAGDPDTESVVLWTRLTGLGLPDEVDVTWEVASDEEFGDITASGSESAIARDGHSVHAIAEVAGPSWYRFRAGGSTSPAGWAAPAPAGATRELRVATASCQHFETGYYAAHRDLAEWQPDLVAFLGDFIYEGAAGTIAPDRPRVHDGPEITDLAAYRARYAQYLSDPDLQAARAVAPWLVVWDDHEVENNYAALVPQEPAESAAFPTRRDDAYQAWWEHMPVRLPRPEPGGWAIHRAVRWGDLADVLLLDGRQYRSDQACGSPVLSPEPACLEALDPARTMLGVDQEAWVGETLKAASATWTVLAQQTVMTNLRLGEAILNYDQWDGYGPARDRLLAQAATKDRLVVLTGDIHLAGVGRLPGVGVEFVTASISSAANVDPSLQPVLDSFVDVVASELVHRGYTRHTVTAERWTAEFRIVDDVFDPASAVSTWRSFHVDAAARDVVVPV
ncbi:alkaline phosphatase D family protein [soil metagenome]